MKIFTPQNTSPSTEDHKQVFTNRPLPKIKPGFLQTTWTPILLGLTVFMLTVVFVNTVSAQCDPCVPNNVDNGNADPWSSECYLDDDCNLQGNPCQANDVTLTGIFIADSMGNPVGACNIGDMVTVLLWGNFNNNTGTDRFAVRTNTEVWIGGMCHIELNSCSFDVLTAGTSAQALVGTFTYECGQTIELRNTWIGWSTSAAQCSNPGGSNYNDVCGEYSPSKCSRTFEILEFLAPNFAYDCGEPAQNTTEVCFTDLTNGGVPPLSYDWDFGDGGMSTLMNPCHTYNATSGTFVVELTVTDADGTTAGAFLEIDLDSLACCNLEFTCPPVDGGFFECIGDVPAPDTNLVVITDSCGPVTTVVEDDAEGTGCKLDTMTITRRYIFTDGNNVDTCVQIFQVTDDLPPVITECPASVTVQCASMVPPSDQTLVTATDNCPGNIVTIFVGDAISGQTCANRYTVTRTYRVSDACLNSATCTQTITVFDNTAPTFTCPPTISVQCADDVPPAAPGSITASDNCGGTATVTHVGDVVSNMTCSDRFNVTRTYRATDVCGNSATCTQTIAVFDNTPPVITACVPSIVLQCAFDVPNGLTFGSVIATDNCDDQVEFIFGGEVVSNFVCVNQFTLLRTWYATDNCGNSASCTYTVTVLDNTPLSNPNCPDDLTVQCASEVPAPTTAGITSFDNCLGLPTITHLGDVISGQTCANRYTVSRTYQAVDECGNSASCTQTITVFDNTVPTFSCPPPVTVQCVSQVPAPAPGSITSSDNCGGMATVTHVGDVISNQTCANRYNVTRTYRATDACGNSATCTQAITVFDNTVPTISCPPNTTVQCVSEVPTPAPGSITSSDNCGGMATVTHAGDVISNQTCVNRYTITRTYNATDACGNSASCTQTITVFDNTAPSFTCPPPVTVQCAANVPSPAPGSITATDNCGGTATVTHVGDAISNQTCTNRYTLTRTYRATDVCGNSASCTQTITVFDNTGPTLTCLGNLTVQCASLVPAANPSAVTATDNCAGEATVTHAGDAISGQTCSNRYTVTRTYQAVDICGNTGTCTQTITVFDNTAPTFSCPGPVTVQCTSQVPPAAPGSITSTDNCGGMGTVTHVGDAISNQTCANRYLVTRTYRATDECGNSATCTQTITVFDNTAPSFTCPPPVTVQCANQVPTPAPGSITSTDNCGGMGTVTHAGDVISNQTCTNRYTLTRTYNATDACGNSASCTQTITVFDNTAPSIPCPANVSVQCASMVPQPAPGSITATDNCGGTATVTHLGDVITNQTCVNRYNIARTYRATDECGNSASCTQTITVFDNTAPSITCPPNVSFQCASQVPQPVPGSITATDNCGGMATVTHVGDVISNQTCTNRYNITRTYRAVDECGNSASCTQTISVFDNTPPGFTCPQNLLFQCANQVPTPAPGSITATDNCGGMATVTHVGDVISNQTCTNRFNITRTYRATDECGNSATCTQTISVFDNTLPTLTCPPPLTVQCANLVPTPVPGSISATDNCGGMATVTHVGDAISNQTCANRYNITRTYRATDECGNSATCTQAITVFDNTPPTVTTCPPAVTVQCASLLPLPNIELVTATDNCEGGATVTHAGDMIFNMTCTNRFNVTRTYLATDACGNSASCTQTLTVFDNTPPSIPCPAPVSVQCANQVPPAAPGSITATDNCGGTASVIHVGDVISNQTCVNRYNITRTYRATDVCGNSASCTQTISVFDNTPPALTCLPGLTVQCASLVPAANPLLITTTDNCGGSASVTHVGDVISGQTCVNRYNVTRTYRATDECGNSATCTQTINVFDNTAPVVTCPEDVTIECDESTLPDNTGTATGTDNCNGIPIITSSDITVEGSCPQEYTILRTWTATDECTNSSSCTQTIEVEDTTPPSIVCPIGLTVQCANLLPDPNINEVTASDNCGIAILAFVRDAITNQTCTNRFTVTRTYRATDECGNTASCTQTIVVFDNTAPTLTCPTGVTVQCATDVPTPNIEGVTATDNCGGESTIAHVSDVISNQVCVNRYNVIRTYSATDECGNSVSCSQIITVFDNTAPTLTCPASVSVQCANLVPAPNVELVTATDNCGGTSTIAHVGDAISGQTCANRFTVTRTYRATDECGNSATCTQTITVFDNTVPTLTCPAGVSVQCANQVPAPNPALVTATDNCGGTATVTHAGDAISNMTCTNRFIVTRTYRATDECGNSATCTQTITVFDNTAPTITCPASVSVQCANQVPAVNPASVTSSDNCGGTSTVTHVGDVISNMTCVNRFNVTRTYRATDACGNSATCTQTITVFDNTVPTITCPPSVSVQCAAQVPPANPGGITSSDNCGGTATVTHVGDVISNMTCANRFRVTRTYRATDACGNSASCTQTITVFDNTPPVITFVDPLLEGIPNGGTLEVACFGQDPEWEFPTFGPGSVNATDNCAGAVNVAYSSVFVDGGNCPVDGYIVLYRLTWTATDVCGNSSSAHVFVALVDEIPPVITGVPDDVTVSCDEIPELPALVMATDECLCACIVLFEEEGPDPGCQDGQVITRTWTATDDCGNQTVETQTITLIDNEGPEIIFTVPELVGIPDGSVLNYTCNEGGIPELFDDLDAGSVMSPVSCGAAGIITFDSETHEANNCEFWGYMEQRTFQWTAVDLCGNETVLRIQVRLIDTEAPTLLNVPEMTCIDDPSLDEIEAIDNCENPSIRFWDVKIPNPCGVGNDPAIRRTYEAFDNCGNFTRDTAILIPNDHAHPVMEFVDPVLAELEFGEILIIDCTGDDGGNYTDFDSSDVFFEDFCMFGVHVVFTETVIEEGDCSDGVLAVLELRWVATDICGNVGEALITAHIVDQTAPELVNFDADVTIGCNDALPETEATDNCGSVTVTYQDEIIPGPCPYEYEVLRKVMAADLCGNFIVGEQLVHVGDGSGPDIEGVEPEICDDLTLPIVTAYDDCADQFVEVTMTEDTLDTECVDGFVLRRTWTAVDICGNVSSVTQDVIIGDTTPPVIFVPTNSIINRYLDVLGPHLVLSSQTEVLELLDDLDDGSVFIIDNCDQLIIPEFTLEVTISENCLLDGFYEHRVYTWVATDACGNVSSISFFVNVLLDEGPELLGVPVDQTVICDELPALPIVTPLDPTIPVIIEFFETIEPGDGPGVFIVIRRWVVRDPCGNETVYTQQILWIPDSLLDCEIIVPEMVECNTHGVVIGSDVSGGQGELTYEWEITGEKCFIQSGQNTPEIIIYIGWSTVQIRLTVTDAFGCSTVCSASLDCVDSALDPLTGLPISTSPETIVIPGVDVNQAGEQATGFDLSHLNLWPNPANGNLSLSFESHVNQEVEFTLTNLLGQVVLSDEIDAVKGFNTRKFDVSLIPEGSYLMQVKSDRDMHTKVVVILHNE